MTVPELQKRFLVLVDVRSAAEYGLGHLFGALNLPLLDLQKNLAMWVLLLPRDVPIVFYCATGALGKQAAQILNQAGFTNATYLVGGVHGWAEVFGPRYLFRLQPMSRSRCYWGRSVPGNRHGVVWRTSAIPVSRPCRQAPPSAPLHRILLTCTSRTCSMMPQPARAGMPRARKDSC